MGEKFTKGELFIRTSSNSSLEGSLGQVWRLLLGLKKVFKASLLEGA